MAQGGIGEDSEWDKFEKSPETSRKYLSTHKPSDPSWNKYVIIKYDGRRLVSPPRLPFFSLTFGPEKRVWPNGQYVE